MRNTEKKSKDCDCGCKAMMYELAAKIEQLEIQIRAMKYGK